MHNYLSKNYKIIIKLVLFFWILLSCIRFLYITKVFAFEDISLLTLSGNEKRNLYYGDLNSLYLKLDSISQKKDCIYLYTKDNTPYFLLRYFFYPKKVYWVNSISKNNRPGENKCNILIFYNQDIRPDSPLFKSIPYHVKKIKFNDSSIFIIK